jgi:hypothetical protein
LNVNVTFSLFHPLYYYMKKLPVLFVLVAFYMISAGKTLAYGGGMGFPPGYFDNPHAQGGLVCEMTKKSLPNGKTIYLPSCHVVHNEVRNHSWTRRLSDFLKRVINGSKS